MKIGSVNVGGSFMSAEEVLVGLRLSKYNFCDGQDEEGNLDINSYYDLSIGLLFFVVYITIPTGENMKIKQGN